jgi:hypothetical protein
MNNEGYNDTMTHPDVPGENSEHLPELNSVKVIICTGIVPMPSAGTYNVEVFPFPSLAHVVQLVRVAAWTVIGPIECMLPIGIRDLKIPICTFTGIQKGTILYFIFDTLGNMILHIPFSRASTRPTIFHSTHQISDET